MGDAQGSKKSGSLISLVNKYDILYSLS